MNSAIALFFKDINPPLARIVNASSCGATAHDRGSGRARVSASGFAQRWQVLYQVSTLFLDGYVSNGGAESWVA
jgi:hypothetical protein